MSSKDLPYDVVIDILSRLPVKTLIRFRCVCKSWYASITHPSFINTRLNRTFSSHDTYLQCTKSRSSKKRKWSLLFEHTRLVIPFDTPSKFFELVGAVNGLICLTDCFLHFGRILFFWNPSIRKSKTLAYSNNPLHVLYPNNYAVLGFGFCLQTNDYKVVRIIHFLDDKGEYIEEAPPQVEVYTLSTDSWRTIEAVVPCFLDGHVSNVFVNGSIHWLASRSREDYDSLSDAIMSFDIGDEVFREMKLPSVYIPAVELESVEFSLAVLKESLSLSVYFVGIGLCNIWVMKEYSVIKSWTKQFTIVVPSIGRSLGFTVKNEFLLESNDGELVSYDLESLQPTYLENRGSTCTMNLVPIKETLVLLDGENVL